MSAIIYARYSPRPQESDSIRNQVEDLQAWCDQQGIEVRMVSCDPDTSGTVGMFDRPGLASALRELRRGDTLVIRNLNRAARSVVVGLMIEEEVERLGAQLCILESGGIQPTKAEDRNAWCMRVIHYLMSDMQRMEINERTSRRMKQHQENGRAMGGCAPFGWEKKDTALFPNLAEQETIKAIVDLHQRGYTTVGIATHLNCSTHQPRGDRWHANTVKRILDRVDGA